MNDILWQMRGQVRYSVQCCGFSVEYIRYDWNGRDEKKWRFNLELANIGSIGNFLGADADGGRQGLGGLPMRLLVTGAGGFVGGHLVDFLRAEHPGVEVHGVVLPHGSVSWRAAAGARVLEADLNDPAAAAAVVEEVRPDRIVHLAGQSSVHQSWTRPRGHPAHQRARHRAPPRRGAPLRPAAGGARGGERRGVRARWGPRRCRIREEAPLRPASPYAVSKVAQGALALLYGPAGGMRVVLTRTFHHTGPGRGEAFAESSFARQIAEIEAGLRPPVLEGRQPRRGARLRRRARRGARVLAAPGEGRGGRRLQRVQRAGRPVRHLLDVLLAASTARVEVRVDPDRLRPSDVPAQVGDPSRLRAATGWEPRIPLERTLRDLLDDWRARTATADPPRP